nr:hypothetical protein [Tanacetum cinerariifolium]
MVPCLLQRRREVAEVSWGCRGGVMGFTGFLAGSGGKITSNFKLGQGKSLGDVHVKSMRIPEIGLHGFIMSYTGPRWKEIDNIDDDFLRVVPSYTSIRDPLRRLCHRLITVSNSGRGEAPEKVTATDLFYLRSMDEGTTVNVPYLLAQYLFRYIEGRKRGARLSSRNFIGRLAEHFEVRRRTGDTNTLAAPLNEDQPDP